MQNRFLGAVLVLVAGAIAAPAPKPVVCEVKVSIRGEWKGAPDTAEFFAFDPNYQPQSFPVRFPMDTTLLLRPAEKIAFGLGFGRGEVVGPLLEIRGRKGISYGACLTSGSLCEVVRKDVTLRENCSID